METNHIERLVKYETKLDNAQDKLVEILSVVKEMQAQHEKFVKHDDPSYFNKNMTRHNQDNLQRRVGWITILDISYKFITTGAFGVIATYLATHWS